MFTLKSLITALFLSLFIYLEYLNLTSYLLNTLFIIIAFCNIFVLSKKELFLTGFLTSILWFWWIGYSFIYYDLIYLIPAVLIGIGVVYGVLFYIIGLLNNIFYKLIYIFLLSFLEPFGFNWFKFELPFVYSYIGSSKIEFFVFITTTAFFIFIKQKEKLNIAIITYIIPIMLLIYYNSTNLANKLNTNSGLKILMNETNIDQDKKWKIEYKSEIVEKNFQDINKAVANGYEIIIFPETSFPLVLNSNGEIKNRLIQRSYDISIVLGSLYEKEGLYYNSTYMFQKGKMEVAHKVVLVPFGEAVPMPEKIRNWINDMFYDGAKDYEVAESPTTFNIKGTKFRNAICYEATTDIIYDNIDTNFVIATSNNAWFTPSIEPSLQKILLQYYANKYDLTIYSVTNKSKSGIIR
ncbi:MAG: apolipoprotein N-acyltransferase [Campylobacterota bacterium]|nr:apolipoprotein N-acyltransferase [Campylobacterota bacterium]